MALGASGTNILRLIFAQGRVQSGVGLAIGLAGAFGLTRVLKAVLSNVLPFRCCCQGRPPSGACFPRAARRESTPW